MSKQIKGILGTKLGMTQVFNDAGQIVPVTVVQAGPCWVTAVRTPDHVRTAAEHEAKDTEATNGGTEDPHPAQGI